MKNKTNGVMLVICHKETKMYSDELYVPLVVGDKKELLRETLSSIAFFDDSGENIAEKNPYFCELTGLFWFWKNKISEYKFAGLCHYRRYFTKSKIFNGSRFYPDQSDIENYLSRYDVILPSPWHWKIPVDRFYYEVGSGKQKDIELLIDVVAERHADYLAALEDVLHSKQASYCNMFIMDTDHLSNYCEWLFDILFALEGKIDLKGYTIQEQRVFGFLSEILLNVWVLKNKLSIKYLKIINTERTLWLRIRNKLKKTFWKK